MDFRKTYYTFVSVFSVLAAAIIYVLYSLAKSGQMSVSDWASLQVTILASILGGMLTLAGVLLTLKWSEKANAVRQSQQDNELKQKRINQMRLLRGELQRNVTVFRLGASSASGWDALREIQCDMWNRLCTSMEWLDNERFDKLAEIYATMELIRHTMQSRAPTDYLSEEVQEKWRQYPDGLEPLISELTLEP